MRLDLFLVQQGLAPTRTRADNLIRLGGVTVDGKVVCKPAFSVDETHQVEVNDVIAYASLGGLKLAKALEVFSLRPTGVAVDIGASNGGFTDCLLQAGASKVFAVDVGEYALPPSLLADPRVVAMPHTDARSLSTAVLGGLADCATVDVSFISLTYILPTLYAILKEGAWAMALVKPQFEVGPKALGKSGVVRDEKKRKQALDKVQTCATQLGFRVRGVDTVPLLFADKNIEYLLHLTK